MTFSDFLKAIGFQNIKTVWGFIFFLMSIGIEFIPQIKFNPWSSLFKWIGSNFNDKLNRKIDSKVDALENRLTEKDKEITKKMDNLNSKVDQINNDLQKHIADSEVKNLQDTRRDILDFCNSCMNGRRHTKEQFDFVIHECDDYEIYVRDNDIKNGVIEAAIKEIRRLYEKCIQEHSFLVEMENKGLKEN